MSGYAKSIKTVIPSFSRLSGPWLPRPRFGLVATLGERDAQQQDGSQTPKGPLFQELRLGKNEVGK